jgi:muconate cycloisomerase
MIVRKVDIWRLKLGFRFPIRHRLALHQGTENLVVKVTPDSPEAGYGEGVPRVFVTGETLPASLAFLSETLAPAVLAQEFGSPPQLREFLKARFLEMGGAQHPGAFCALETALLDAAGRAWDLPLAAFCGPRSRHPLTYSAVIPLLAPEPLTGLLRQVKGQGMTFLKVKVGQPDDLATLKSVRDILGWEVNLRVDANCAWSPPEAVRRLRELQPFRLSAVEQPVAKGDLEGLREVSAATGLPVIADESLCTEADAQRLIDLKACQIFNLRLSKCGGPGAAVRLRDMAAAAGIRCQLGCQVGETSILAAAGRHFAASGPELVYLEGCYAPYLLAREPAAPTLAFGYGGRAPELAGPGLGLRVLDQVLEELSVAHLELAA